MSHTRKTPKFLDAPTNSAKSNFADSFFKDARGITVLFQRPNRLLLIAAAIVLLSMVTGGWLRLLAEVVAYGLGFTWGYSELTAGVNGFRKTIGVVVLILLVFVAYRSISRLP